jgi:hypothetical protein
MKKKFILLFLIVSTGELISKTVSVHWLEMICKPAIMISLGLFYWAAQREKKEPVVLTVILAIFFFMPWRCAVDVSASKRKLFYAGARVVLAGASKLYTGIQTASG